MLFSAGIGDTIVNNAALSNASCTENAARYAEWCEKAAACTFGQYLELYRHHCDPRGDFARDGFDDTGFPSGAKSWETVESYLLSKRACIEAFEAGRQIWRSYVRDMAQWGDEELVAAWEHERCSGLAVA
ncbi:YozE family protein [Croceicoccus sp. YJ47]|uniref:YozE family protein n=1 Tax=Croceicoccus sp. YJ47 TaxID=2798724 RepID=UPI001920A027|nr:YozE family protein [Croceicoccus sp. YJ47]QQN74705.1 hypothetical protein JD971_02905 [Croceicoccus sp. YJ47]